MRKPNAKSRARAIRRAQSRADKRRRQRTHRADSRESAPTVRHTIITNNDGSPPHLHDDCPICRAMADVGVLPDADGVAALSAAQVEALRKRKAEIIAEEGWPEGAIFMSGEELSRRYDEVQRVLAERGFPTESDGMTEEELDAFLVRGEQVWSELEERDASRVRATA